MKIVKHCIYIIVLTLSMNSIFGQTLKISDFRKSFIDYKQTEHKQVFLKGFKLKKDTTTTNQNKFKFSNLQTKEIIELTFTEREGGEYLSIMYFMPTESSYKNFISMLTILKFIFG